MHEHFVYLCAQVSLQDNSLSRPGQDMCAHKSAQWAPLSSKIRSGTRIMRHSFLG